MRTEEFVFLVRDKDREALEAFLPRVKLSTADLAAIAKLGPYEFLYVPGPGPHHITTMSTWERDSWLVGLRGSRRGTLEIITNEIYPNG